LGTLLYTLLTGTHPYQIPSHSYHELEISTCEGNPKRPSTALQSVSPADARQLRGDLDTIVLTAMRKEPQRRYSSAEHMADYVRRHLQHEPLAARPDTWLYRTQKFVERNKIVVAASLVVVAALVTLGIMDRIDRLRAERNFSDLREFANFTILKLDDEMRKSTTQARALLTAKGVEYLNKLAKQTQNETSLKLELIRGYLKVADLQGNLWKDNIGNPAAARESIAKAVAIAEMLPPRDLKNNPDARSLVADSEVSLADLLGTGGDRAAALDHYRKALAIRQTDSADPRPAISVLGKIAEMQDDVGDPGAALESLRQAEQLAAAWASADPNNSNGRDTQALARQRIADYALRTGLMEGSEAEAAVRASIATYESGNLKPPGRRRNLELAYRTLAEVERSQGKTAEALETCRRSVALGEELFSADSKNSRFSIDIAQEKVLLIQLLRESGERNESRKQTATTLAWLRPIVRRDNPSIYYLSSYVELLDDTPLSEIPKEDDPVTAAKQYVQISKSSESLDLLARALERGGNLTDAAAYEQQALDLLPPWQEGALSQTTAGSWRRT
jgi:hypothetical protein